MSLKLRFDLVDLLHSTVKDKQRRTALTPFINRESVKREFGERAIDAILERTLQGKDKRDNSFVAYSKAYKESREFAIFGKSSRVNLRLSGQMHASVHVNGTDRTGVTIAITDVEQERKARRHINGSGPLPVRDFWGLSKEDQSDILMGIVRNQAAVDEFEQVTDALAALGEVTAAGATLSNEEEISEFLVGVE